MNLQQNIAKAIKKADRSYFFEDYTKQARAVLKTLEQSGYTIVPLDPPKDLLRKVADTISTGSMKPEDHVRNVFRTLITQFQKN